jgi:hypothetical protein
VRAAVCTAYGPPEVLQVRDIAQPTPKQHDVLIKISAAAVTASDCIVLTFCRDETQAALTSYVGQGDAFAQQEERFSYSSNAQITSYLDDRTGANNGSSYRGDWHSKMRAMAR